MQDHKFTRDKSSAALINTDRDGLLSYRQKRLVAKQTIEATRQLEARVLTLEKIVEELCILLNKR